MRAGGGDLKRAAAGVQAAYVAEVEIFGARIELAGRRGGEELFAAELVDESEQVRGGEHCRDLRPAGLRALGFGADEAEVARGCGDGGGQDTGDLVNAAVEGEFAEGCEFRQLLAGQNVHGGEDGQGNGQVEMAAFLLHIGGGEVDQHAFGRQRQPHGGEGGADTLAGFADGFVRQADDEEHRQTAGNLDLYLDALGIDSREGK